jgi:hypothetical protein
MEKTILLVIFICIPFVQSANAESAYQSGFKHGVSDAHQPDTSKWYILQHGNGFKFHSQQFVNGYVNGFCSILPQVSSDANEASWDCAQGPPSAAWITK